jgi:hypothetical protein
LSSAIVGLLTVSVAALVVAVPDEAPPFVLTCHCTVGEGDPLAAAEKDAVALTGAV